MGQTIREQVYDDIKERITSGKILPGERLTENELASTYKSSRSPIREALRQLESEGLLISEKNKGFKANKLSNRHAIEILDVRILLESRATRMTAESIDREKSEALSAINASFKMHCEQQNLRGRIKSNEQFHAFIHEHCGNETMQNILHNLQSRVYRIENGNVPMADYLKTFYQQHENIVSACLSNNGEAAEQYMKEHLELVKRMLNAKPESFSTY